MGVEAMVLMQGIKPYYDHAGITIYHGDCREILPGMPDNMALVSDPPYGMDYDTNGDRFTLGGRSFPKVHDDDKPFDAAFWCKFPQVVLWGFNHFPSGLDAGGSLVWIKRSDAAFGCFLSDAEVAWVKGIKGVYCFRDTHHAIAGFREHPTEKPEGLMRWAIERSTAPEDVTILDPFMGSGTTLVAAKRHSAKVAWRALAMLQLELEAARKANHG